MKHWWVNQNQTAQQEIEGCYLWSPKLARGDKPIPAYENMKEIEPGDRIFSYHDRQITHYGIARGRALSSPKPEEFGKIGQYWSDSGWLVAVEWHPLESIERDLIGKEANRIFDEFESPFTISHTVKQAYLFRISSKASDYIMLLGKTDIFQFAERVLELEPTFFSAEREIDDLVEKEIIQRTDLPSTEKETIIDARRGQGLFRKNLSQIESFCRVTKVDDYRILVASHIKPWRACGSTYERLDGNNGLLLTPTMDRLFDHRYMTFEDDGKAILSKKLSPETYDRIGLHPDKVLNVGKFRPEQIFYLKYHRNTFLG
jgi:putative restriction endonuclease